jgi:hypothetical protein
MADLLKTKMEGILDALEQPARPFAMSAAPAVQPRLEMDYRPAWEILKGGTGPVGGHVESLSIVANYQGGEPWLLSSLWHQGPPYNNMCPDMGCDWPQYDNYNQRAVVGCGATAIAQIMRYWSWPPNGEHDDDVNGISYTDSYDWVNMSNGCHWSSSTATFTDGTGNLCQPAQIDALAELSYEVGRALNSTYTCGGTASNVNDQDVALVDHFRYAGQITYEYRSDMTAAAWFDAIKADLNKNRPISYAIPGHNVVGHNVVVDGWKDDAVGKRYHVNYGWKDEGMTMWYNLDEIAGGDPTKEVMRRYIRPGPSLGPALEDGRIYPTSLFNYRYFDQDATGRNVAFAAGQNLQFLPKVKVTCSGTSDNYIYFFAEGANDTRLFSIKGTQSAGILVTGGGAVVLHGKGGIRFH